MELVRNGPAWPRGETYGDLLIAAGRRGVRVRLLVWHSISGGQVQKHLPGYTHGHFPWRIQPLNMEVPPVNAERSLQLILEHSRNNRHEKEWDISRDKLEAMAREEYCSYWYRAALAGRLPGISIRIRDGDMRRIKDSLDRERRKPDAIERQVLTYGGTHHQKTILIDFAYNDGKKALGYVMGLNSMTAY